MTGKEWAAAASGQQDLWCPSAVIGHYPQMIQTMYTQLYDLAGEGSIYGLFLQLRYCFEALIRWYVLVAMAQAGYLDDAETVAWLVDPGRSLSFGDWVNVFPRKLAKQPQRKGTCLGRILIKLAQQYESGRVVRWRNETVGHGALQQDSSPTFQAGLEQKLRLLRTVLEDNAPAAAKICYRLSGDNRLFCNIDGGDEFPLEPFFHAVENDLRLFDSLCDANLQTCFALSFLTGERAVVPQPYFFELQARFYGLTPVTRGDSYDDAVFTTQLEETLRHFHDPQRYWKQQHYMDTLLTCMERHPKGVFLLRSESGTGKSTFTGYIDALGKQKLKGQGITCRSYSFSRMSFRSRGEFLQALQLNFSLVPEDETSLLGALPTMDPNAQGEKRAQGLAVFLNEFRSLHEQRFGRERLLLVLDGIDELQSRDTDLLHFIPDGQLLDEGVYILVTCRVEHMEGTFQEDFLRQHPFEECMEFDRTKENRELLKQAIADSVTLVGQPLTGEQIDRLCLVLDDRFTGLPVIRTVLWQTADFDAALTAPTLLSAYTTFLRQLYGARYFHRVETLLCTMALAPEPLSIRLMGDLAFRSAPTGELLALMKDLLPLLSSSRDSQGAKYHLAHQDFVRELSAGCPDLCKQLVLRWRERLYENSGDTVGEYNVTTYLAANIYPWSRNILGESTLEAVLLEILTRIAGFFSQSRDSVLHMIRIVRIMSGAKECFTEQWNSTGEVQALARALDAITTCMHKLVMLEDMAGCRQTLEDSEALISQFPNGWEQTPDLARIVFANLGNCVAMASHLGDLTRTRNYQIRGVELLIPHPEWFPPEQRNPFLYNWGTSLLHTDPQASLVLCGILLGFPDISQFQRARALTLKSDALLRLNSPDEAEPCLLEAMELVKTALPQRAQDVAAYPNTLLHYGNYLNNHKQDFSQAASVLEDARNFYDVQAKHGAFPSRHEYARICSAIGQSYYGMDAQAQNRMHRQASLWHHDQAVRIYQDAVSKNLQFHPAEAGPIFLNAAYAYFYYQEPETAFLLIDEIEKMQTPEDPYSMTVLKQCADVRDTLSTL